MLNFKSSTIGHVVMSPATEVSLFLVEEKTKGNKFLELRAISDDLAVHCLLKKDQVHQLLSLCEEGLKLLENV